MALGITPTYVFSCIRNLHCYETLVYKLDFHFMFSGQGMKFILLSVYLL